MFSSMRAVYLGALLGYVLLRIYGALRLSVQSVYVALRIVDFGCAVKA